MSDGDASLVLFLVVIGVATFLFCVVVDLIFN